MNAQQAKNKALAASALFLAIGVCGLFYAGIENASLPLVIFYATVTLNTFFSIKLFSQLTPPRNVLQTVADVLLVVIYAGLAFAFAEPAMSAIITLALFVVATLKYILLKRITDHPALLRNKISINCLGIVMSLLVVMGVSAGYPLASAWFLAIVFGLANIYLLFVKPMYRI